METEPLGIMSYNEGVFHCRTDLLECYLDEDQYKSSGVNIQEGNKVVQDIAKIVEEK